MKTRTLMLAVVGAAAFASTASAQQPAGFWITPAIPGIGPVHVWPQAVLRPDAAASYKALFDVTKGAATDDKVNGAIDHIARTVNAFAAVGVPLSHLKFVVVIHGPATPIALDAKTFQAKYGHANPNLEAIDALTKAGVEITVCGNALGEIQLTPDQINPNLKIALSALSTIVILQNQGYALVSM